MILFDPARTVAELLKSYDSIFLRLILESNEKRKEEIENDNVRREVEKVRKRVEALERSFVRAKF